MSIFTLGRLKNRKITHFHLHSQCVYHKIGWIEDKSIFYTSMFVEQFSNGAIWGCHPMPYFKIPRTEKYGMRCAMIMVTIIVMTMVVIMVLMTTGLQRSRVLSRISFARLSFPWNCISSRIVRINETTVLQILESQQIYQNKLRNVMTIETTDYCPQIEICRLLK